MFTHNDNLTIPDELFKALNQHAPASVLVVGIGSSQAGDSIGWHMADLIGQQKLLGIVIRRALVPLDLLDWIEDYSFIHLLDAMPAGGATLKCWKWPDCAELLGNATTSHTFDLVSVLQLASALNKTKARIWIWGLPLDR